MAEELHIENLKIPVGISSCLLGEKVRYDGGHKGHSYIRQTLGGYFDFQPFCPEVTIGLGIPRKPIRLWKNENDNLESSIHMSNLGNCKNQNDLSNMLEPLIEEYANWINQTKTEVER